MDGRGELIAWIGGQFFQQHMEALGFRTVRIPLSSPAALGWEDICAHCGQAPDAVVYADRSLPPPLLGLEAYPCLTAFYCVDAHIHGWYPAYAGAFDLCAVSLKDLLPLFAAELSPGRVLWLPPFAEDRYRPTPALAASPPAVDMGPGGEPVTAGGQTASARPGKEFGLLFAGTVDPETTPQRHAFLERLGRVFPALAVRRGDFAELFPRARVALNIAERGDLNFRVFEALACGACLLTPRIKNGQNELFEDGVHLVTYAPDDEADCAAKAGALIADKARRNAFGRAGFALVDALHRPRHRAAALAGLLRQGFDAGLPGIRLAAPNRARRDALRLLFLRWAEHCGDAALAGKYLAESRRLARPRG